MDGKDVKDIRDDVARVTERVAIVETEVKAVKDDVSEIKSDVKCLDRKIPNILANHAVTKYKLGMWGWFIRISMIAIMSALITKLVNLW